MFLYVTKGRCTINKRRRFRVCFSAQRRLSSRRIKTLTHPIRFGFLGQPVNCFRDYRESYTLSTEDTLRTHLRMCLKYLPYMTSGNNISRNTVLDFNSIALQQQMISMSDTTAAPRTTSQFPSLLTNHTPLLQPRCSADSLRNPWRLNHNPY